MFKNILLGLGSAGVVGGGGYMIYNATRSGDDKSVEDESGQDGKSSSTGTSSDTELQPETSSGGTGKGKENTQK